MTWSPASDNIGVHHYIVYRDTVSGFIPLSDDSLGVSFDTVYIDLEVDRAVIYYYRVSAVDSSGNEGEYSDEVQATIPTGIRTEGFLKSPKSFFLMQNYPNPFNHITEIRYILPRDCYVKLEVFNLLGQKMAMLIDQRQTAGYKSIRWNASSFAHGTYFYRLQVGADLGTYDFVQMRKLVIMH